MFKYSSIEYNDEPQRSAEFKINCKQPYNAEPPPKILINSFITKNDEFYVRSHAPVPYLDLYLFRLVVNGNVRTPKVYSIDDLKCGKFEIVNCVATLMCAGNRRNELSHVKKVKGVGWDQCALSNALWTGIRLRDLLEDVGANLDDSKLHVEFEGLDFHLPKSDEEEEDGLGKENIQAIMSNKSHILKLMNECSKHYMEPILNNKLEGYGSSIPMNKAKLDALIVWKMNGEELPADHGYPIRAIVPKYIGARSVKWLWRITVMNHESNNFYQQKDYKVLPPEANFDNVDTYWNKCPAILDLTPQASICTIEILDDRGSAIIKCFTAVYPEIKVNDDEGTLNLNNNQSPVEVIVKGYAIGHMPVHVYLSLNGGESWESVKLSQEKESNVYFPNAWYLWEHRCKITIPCELICRAESDDGQKMAENIENIWNLRGVMNNAWHKIKII